MARRTEEQAQALVERAREIFEDIAGSHKLRAELAEDVPVDVHCTLPQQTGLAFPLYLLLDNEDELCCQSDFFCASFFPADDPEREKSFIEAVDGIISGDVRLLCFHSIRTDRIYRVELQRRQGGKWRTFYTYGSGFPWRWRWRTEIRSNVEAIARDGAAEAQEI